jgi:hypothetical protein
MDNESKRFDWTPFYRRFPNAEAHWGFDGVDIPWDADRDHSMIIVTEDPNGSDDGVMVGVYLDDGWMEGDEPQVMIVFDGVETAFGYVDDITDLQPEGTHWGAWVTQWTADHLTDGLIAGVLADRAPYVDGVAYPQVKG